MRVVPVVAQMTAHQYGQQVRGGHARGGMSRARAGAGSDRVHPQLLAQLPNRCQVDAGRRFAALGHGAHPFWSNIALSVTAGDGRTAVPSISTLMVGPPSTPALPAHLRDIS